MTAPGAPRLLVVEPHSDDAYLSLHGHLLAWQRAGYDVLLVTVFGDEDVDGRRWAEAARYARSAGASWVGCGLPESGAGIADTSWQAVDLADLTEPGGLLWRMAEGRQQLWPLGLRHPEHRAVAGIAPEHAWRYLEQPYAAKHVNEQEVQLALAGRPIISWLRPRNAAKANAADLFASQRRFFFHEADNMRNAPELIVGPRP